MMKETGRVVALDGTSAWVETLRQSSCSKCNARAGCGHGILNTAKPGASRAVVQARLPAPRAFELGIHDTVEIALPESHFLRGVALLYAFPLLMAVGAALLGERFVPTGAAQAAMDLRVALSAISGLIVGLAVVRLVSNRLGSAENGSRSLLPVVTAKLPAVSFDQTTQVAASA